jgi:hypothetical protein
MTRHVLKEFAGLQFDGKKCANPEPPGVDCSILAQNLSGLFPNAIDRRSSSFIM